MRHGPWGECPRCGLKRRLATFKQEWTGVRVCRDCWDPRNPQMDVRGRPDRQTVSHPAPEPAPVYVGPGDVTPDDL